jgi:hypothetical protein
MDWLLRSTVHTYDCDTRSGLDISVNYRYFKKVFRLNMEKVVSRRRATDLLRLLRDIAIIFISTVRPTVVSDSMNKCVDKFVIERPIEHEHE